jgi:hypothetical protein
MREESAAARVRVALSGSDGLSRGGVLNEIQPGVFWWKALHPNLGIEVSSYCLADSGTLIDPLVPAEGVEWFSVDGRPDPQRVLLTNRHHLRDSARFDAEFGCSIHCHEAGLHEFAAGPDVEGFFFGDEVAPGVVAHEVGAICPEETALHIAHGNGLLAVADGVINYGGVRFVRDSLLGDSAEEVKRGLRDAYGRLLELEFDALLFAHGDPIPEGGKAALREFVAG